MERRGLVEREFDLLPLLDYIDPSILSYQEWINVGFALKHTASDWDNWSLRDPARYRKFECFKKWDTFNEEAGSIVTGVTLVRALLVEEIDLYNYGNYKKLKEFLKVKDNQEAFAWAWLDGYEVEKEKRYRVLKAYLGKALYFSQDIAIESYKVTRKELEEAGFGDVFNSPLFEVEEVE